MDKQLAPLLDAILAVAEDVELDGVLDRVVQASRTMIGAQYAALGVLDDEGTGMARFLHAGIDEATAAAIGDLPRGRGLLGEVIHHPEPLLLDDRREHPSSVELPPHHPPMTSFLGVPVTVGGTVFGNLYLTDKPGGFTTADRRLVIALAAVAGAAIRNARDVDALAATARIDAAVVEVATTVLGGATADEGLDLVASRAASLAGLAIEQVTLTTRPPGAAGEVTVSDGTACVRVSPDGDALALPEIPAADLAELATFARRVGIALGYARARDEVERLAVRVDRERIARDLHDTVIQRLFGAGLQLDGLARGLDDDRAASTVEVVIGELDAAIGELRATIAAMHDPGPLPVADRLRAVIAALQPVTIGLQPLQVHGDPERVPAAAADDLVAALREGITNAMRHATATAITASLTVEDEVVLEVVDDGVGPASGGGGARRGGGLGLGNLEARARRHGGGCTLQPGPDGGAQLRWWIPSAAG